MKFNQLNSFRAVVECKTVTAAAKRLGISQPAVSRLLTALETRLGFILFNRTANRITLSEKGKAFYFEVTKIFDDIAGLDEAAESIRTQNYGSLHIAVMPLLSCTFLPSVANLFLLETPQVNMSLKTYRSEEVIRRVQSQSVDLGFAFRSRATKTPGIKTRKVSCDSVCLLHKSSTLAKLKVIDVNDLDGQTLISHECDPVQEELDLLFNRHCIRVCKKIEVSLSITAAKLVGEGIGLVITDPFTAHSACKDHNVISVPLAFSAPFSFDILYPAMKAESQRANRFVELLETFANEIDIEINITKTI